MGTTKSDKLEGLHFDLQSSYSHGPTWIPLESGATSGWREFYEQAVLKKIN